MSIVIVGGHDRMHCQYKEICKRYGCKCKVFTHCPSDFKSKIGTPNIVVLFTSTVAHKMVNVATMQAAKTGAYVARSHSSSACALTNILEEYFAKAE